MHCIQIFTSIVLFLVGASVLSAFAIKDEGEDGHFISFGIVSFICSAFCGVGIFGVLTKNKTLMRVGMYGILSYCFILQLITMLIPVSCKGEGDGEKKTYAECLTTCLYFGFPASLVSLIACAILYFCWKKFLFENKEVYFET